MCAHRFVADEKGVGQAAGEGPEKGVRRAVRRARDAVKQMVYVIQDLRKWETKVMLKDI